VNVGKSTISGMGIKEEDMSYFLQLFPKYLNFYTKPNDYGVKDWDWLISKIEKRIKVWYNRWFS
jgi:hypothetical protein